MKISDEVAKEVLRSWPMTLHSFFKSGTNNRWIRAHPKIGDVPGPTIKKTGSNLFKTTPDGMWINVRSQSEIDVIAVEACGTIQNLRDKRDRFNPSTQARVVSIQKDWLGQVVYPKEITARKVHEFMGDAFASSSDFDRWPENVEIPIGHMRALFILSDSDYQRWKQQRILEAHEYLMPASPFTTNFYHSKKMKTFIANLIPESHYFDEV